MSDNDNNQFNNTTHGRRSSFAGQALADIFGITRARPSVSGEGTNNNNTDANPVNQYPGSVSSAAAQAQQRRRMSTTAVGISGTNNQTSPFGGTKRSDSTASTASGSIDESAIEDGEGLSQSPTSTPFARRMSFGARALRDVKVGAGTSSTNESGYNWADSFRNRAERRSSIASSSGGSPNPNHQRAKSVATTQPAAPVKQAEKPMVPDHFQERILKGDFYMD